MVLFLWKEERMPRGYAIGPTMRRGDPWVRLYPTLDAGNHRLEGGASYPRLEMVGQAEEDMDGSTLGPGARGQCLLDVAGQPRPLLRNVDNTQS
jgi:hypothetical protein